MIPSSEFRLELSEILYGCSISRLHVKIAYEFGRWEQNKFWLFYLKKQTYVDIFIGDDAVNHEFVGE
jgi:hypothetical protein